MPIMKNVSRFVAVAAVAGASLAVTPSALATVAETGPTAVTAVTAVSAAPKLSPSQLRKTTDRYLFTYSMKAFLKVRAAEAYNGQLDWSSDACSKSPDKPNGFNFKSSCQRHDFGYRNYKKQKRFTGANRAKIDKQFKNDMYDVCKKYKGLKAALGVQCRRIADTYYHAVRHAGK